MTGCMCSFARSFNNKKIWMWENKGYFFLLFLFVFFPLRRERQRSFLSVVHLWGHGSRRSADGHVCGSGVSHWSGLWSARDGEKRLYWSLMIFYFLFFFCFTASLCVIQIHYVILKDESGDSQFFSIDSHSGIIFTRASFDREQKASYLIEVQSQDGSESARQGQQGQPNTGNAQSERRPAVQLI